MFNRLTIVVSGFVSRPVVTRSIIHASRRSFFTSRQDKPAFTSRTTTLISAAFLTSFTVAGASWAALDAPNKPETVSAVVAKTSDLNDGEMKEVIVNNMKILLSKVDGQFYATDLKCTHYGAPLNTGVLVGETLTCPWHNAQFSVIRKIVFFRNQDNLSFKSILTKCFSSNHTWCKLL